MHRWCKAVAARIGSVDQINDSVSVEIRQIKSASAHRVGGHGPRLPRTINAGELNQVAPFDKIALSSSQAEPRACPERTWREELVAEIGGRSRCPSTVGIRACTLHTLRAAAAQE